MIKRKQLHKYGLNTISYSLILSFVLSCVFGGVTLLGSQASAAELIEQAFAPAKVQETIINLGNTKNAVGNEILRESVGVQAALGQGCFVQGQKVDGTAIKKQMCEVQYGGTFKKISLEGNGNVNLPSSSSAAGLGAAAVLGAIDPGTAMVAGAVGVLADGDSLVDIGVVFDQCELPSGETKTMANSQKPQFCAILGGVWNLTADQLLTKQAPLIVRIAKFLLRMTIVLSITMVIYSGIMYIIEASKGAEVTEARNNLLYIVGGVLLALMSLSIINLISSLSISSLGF